MTTTRWIWLIVLLTMPLAFAVGCSCGDDDDDDSGSPSDDDADDDADDDSDDDADDDVDDDADDDVQPQCVDNDGDSHGENCDAGPDCDDADENNWSRCDTCADADADGYYAACDDYASIDGPDCNDGDPSVWQFLTGYTDEDGDFYNGTESQVCSGDTLPFGYTEYQDDCDDADPDVNPDGFDVPDDGIDQDCVDGDYVADNSNGFFVDEAGGNDANAGTKAAPFATVQKGVDEAELIDGGKNIYIAEGSYDESVTTAEASLFGGYDATDWTRDVVSNITEINGQATFAVYAAPAIPVTVDGLTLNAPDSGASVFGLYSLMGVVRVSNNIFGGGDDSAVHVASYNIFPERLTVVDNEMTTGSNLSGSGYGLFAYGFDMDIRDNVINVPEVGATSVGIRVTAVDNARVDGNETHLGQAATGAIGLYLSGAAASTDFVLRGNTTFGGDVTGGSVYGCALLGGRFTLLNNICDAGTTDVGSAYGLYVTPSFGLYADGNTAFTDLATATYGASVTNLGEAVFTNNVVKAGLSATNSLGLLFSVIDGDSVVANNTIFASSAGTGDSYGAILVPYWDNTSTSMTAINNIIDAGNGAAGSTGVIFDNGGSFAELTFAANNITGPSTPDCLFYDDIANVCVATVGDIDDCLWSDCAVATGNKSVNPGFVNAGSGNYDLTAGSGMVDAGVNPFMYYTGPFADWFYGDLLDRVRPRGSGWDIGAYERQP